MTTRIPTGIKKPAPKGQRSPQRSDRTCGRRESESCGCLLPVCWLGCAKLSVCGQFDLILATFWNSLVLPFAYRVGRYPETAGGFGLRSVMFNDVLTCHGDHCADFRTHSQALCVRNY